MSCGFSLLSCHSSILRIFLMSWRSEVLWIFLMLCRSSIWWFLLTVVIVILRSRGGFPSGIVTQVLCFDLTDSPCCIIVLRSHLFSCYHVVLRACGFLLMSCRPLILRVLLVVSWRSSISCGFFLLSHSSLILWVCLLCDQSVNLLIELDFFYSWTIGDEHDFEQCETDEVRM